MAQSKKSFRCPECGMVGPATYSHRESGRSTLELRRRYRCDSCWSLFTTAESPVRRTPTLDELMVRGVRGSETDRNRSFNRYKITKRLVQLTPKTLTESDFRAVVATVEQLLVVELDHAHQRSGHVRIHPPSHPHAGKPFVDVATVDETILVALKTLGSRSGTGIARERFRSAHVKFALGLVDHKAPNESWKWSTAADVIAWIRGEYRDEFAELPDLPEVGRPIDRWWPPSHLPTIPIEQVIKNFRPEDLEQHQGDSRVTTAGSDIDPAPEGGWRSGAPRRIRPRAREPFDQDKLRKKLESAVRGRTVRRFEVHGLLSWVLWGLQGQRLVRTSQLSASIADGLRSFDDIAYLRWVAIGKELSMRELLDEAVSLAASPSPLLTFDATASQPVRPLIKPGPRLA